MFKAQIANYFGHGINGDTLSLRLGRCRVKIIQKSGVISQSLNQNGFVHTTEIEIEGIKNFSNGEILVNDICRLLSLASMSQVVPFAYEFGNNGKSINVSGQAMLFRPLFAIQDGQQIKSFVEQVWPKYRKLKRARKLPEVIEMLTIAELPNQPLEVKLLQGFVVLENLKGTYAHSKNIPFVKGSFRKISEPPKQKPANEPKLGFEQLLKNMFKEVGMKPNLRRAIKLRNEIIHFGLSRKPYKSLAKDYDNCQDLIREYLLRFLQFDGRYLVYSKACRDSKEIKNRLTIGST